MNRPVPSLPSRRDFLRIASAATLGVAAGHRPLRADSPTLPPKLGVALLGLGKYSTGELGPALRLTQNCELRGLITGSPAKAEAWSKQYGVAAKNIYNYENLESIAGNPDIDIVYIVTPPGVHRHFTERVAKAGKHVITEKPMATTVEDCNAMIAACARAKVRLSVGYRLHFDPYHRKLMEAAADPSFGPFMTITGDRGFVFKQRAWRIDKKLGGGGPMMDLGIYIIHGACMAANGATPLSVTAHEFAKTKPELFNEVEEKMGWTMTFPNGSVCQAVAGFNHSSDEFRAEGPHGFFALGPHAFTYRGMGCTTSRGALHFDPPVNQQALQIDDFADCVRTGRATPVPGELGRRDIRILEAIYEAARTGQSVTV